LSVDKFLSGVFLLKTFITILNLSLFRLHSGHAFRKHCQAWVLGFNWVELFYRIEINDIVIFLQKKSAKLLRSTAVLARKVYNFFKVLLKLLELYKFFDPNELLIVTFFFRLLAIESIMYFVAKKLDQSECYSLIRWCWIHISV